MTELRTGETKMQVEEALEQLFNAAAPEDTFAAALEQRLLAQHVPESTTRRGSWLAALFRPVGRLAWVGLVMLLAVGLTLMFRALSQGEAQPAGGTPTLPALCQPVNEGEATYLNVEGGYCVLLSLENPVRQEGARSTVMSAASMPVPDAGTITIEHEDARGRSAEQLFTAAIAPRSVDPTLWTVSEVPFAGGTALLRRPTTPDMKLSSELFAVVGERAYHLMYYPGDGSGVDTGVWDRVLSSFSVLSGETLSALAACPSAGEGGSLASVYGYCLRHPANALQQHYRMDSIPVNIIGLGMSPDGAGVAVTTEPDDGQAPLEELLYVSFLSARPELETLQPTTLGGSEALEAIHADGSRVVVTRANGYLYRLMFGQSEPSPEGEALWQMALDSFTFVPPLIELAPMPPRETPTPAPTADMLLTATPAPTSFATPTPVITEPTLLPTALIPVTMTPAPVEGDPERFPITELVRAPAITVDGVSPDGQWVTYWELSESGGMSSTGMLVLSDWTGTTLCTPTGAATSRDNIFAPQPWLPDGRYVYAGEDGSLRLLDTPCDEPRNIALTGTWRSVLAASQDGQRLALRGQDRLWLWTEGKGVRTIGDVGSSIFPGAAFSPDGRWLAVQSGPTDEFPATRMTLVDSEGRLAISGDVAIHETPIGGGENRPGEAPVWLDNQRVVVMVPDGEPTIFTIPETLSAVQPLSAFFGVGPQPDMAHSVQSNGSTLLWVRSRGVETELHRYDLATGEVTSSAVSAASLRALLAPNSADLLLIEERPDSESRVWVQRASGEIVAGPAVGTVVSGTWAPDGTRYAVGSSEGLVVVELGEGGEQTITPLTAGRVDFLHWAPDNALWALVRVGPEETRLLRVEMER